MSFQLSKLVTLGLATGISAGAASAEEVKIKVGAHAFLDYENISVADETIADGLDTRLARLDLSGSYENYSFVSNFDVQGGDVTIQDLFVDLKGDTTVRIGAFKVPNSLEQISSLYSTTFMEAPSIRKINGIGRQLGVGVFRNEGPMTFAAGVFGPNANSTSDEDMYSVSGRATYAMHPAGDDSTLHLGVSSRYRKVGADDAPNSFSQKPFANGAPKTIKTSAIADSDVLWGLEGAFLKGGLSFQTEYSLTAVNCNANACDDDPNMTAYYADVSYMWGGHRKYKDGVFKRDVVENPVGKGGKGALSVSARYDVADLNDGSVRGGKQDTFIAGATWYRDKNFRVMLNYAHAELTDSPTFGDESADSILLRAQIEIF